MKIAILALEPFDFDSESAASIRAKAHGMTERGHQVWVLTPGSNGSGIKKVKGVDVWEIPFTQGSHPQQAASFLSSWMAAATGRLVRLHREQYLDILDIPGHLTGICQILSNAMGWKRLPAMVRIGGKPTDVDGLNEASLQLYRLDGELGFHAANPMESHIAILRLENFFHGVLNRHYAAYRPAA